jgi:diaminopimelate decarboxylase
MICNNVKKENGHLYFAGLDTVALAKEYGTPLMLFDSDKYIENVNTYISAMREAFDDRAMPLYAGKALCIVHLYRLLKPFDVGVDVVSSGELFTALTAGFPAERIYFHGNNKTDDDILFGVASGVGYFVCDNRDELLKINEVAHERGVVQNILIRLTPSVDAHTYEAVNTGKLDSKFGVAIETGDAEELIKTALELESVSLCGFHCHIGSQIFDAEPFVMAANTMADFCIHLKNTLGYSPEILNLGGGIGVKYLESDPEADIRGIISQMGKALHKKLDDSPVEFPKVRLEPGRSLVANCGMTLYTVGAIKEISGVKNYVSVNGGMADNPRYALYGAPYTVELANRADLPCDYPCTVAGRCCESGDVIQENVMIPKPVRGDILAVLTTGAYNYSMASHYNRLPKPPIVALSEGRSEVVVRRETLKDLLSCDMVLRIKE